MVALNIRVVDNNTLKLTTTGTAVLSTTFATTSGTGALRQVRFYAPNANTTEFYVAFYNSQTSPTPTIPSTLPAAAPFWMPIPAGAIEVFDMGQNDTIAYASTTGTPIVYATLCEGAARN